MTAIAQSGIFVLIIFVGFIIKHFKLVQAHDYKVLQTIVFDFTLPAAIIVSFVTNRHDTSFLFITLFALICASLPIPVLYLFSRHRKVSERAFLMLNGAGFNVGTFCFPILQTFLGSSMLVVASMFDMGNAVIVTAGLNVITASLLHIDMNHPLAEQYVGPSPIVPSDRPTDPDAKRLRNLSLICNVAHGFLSSPSFDTYVAMIIVTIFDITLPRQIATVLQPLSQANPFISMLMVGMLMEFPKTYADIRAVTEVIAWRMPFALIFALIAWFALPFAPLIRKAVAMMCFAPTAIFSTLFTDRVLGSPKLAGFTMAVSAFIAIIVMTVLNIILLV